MRFQSKRRQEAKRIDYMSKELPTWLNGPSASPTSRTRTN